MSELTELTRQVNRLQAEIDNLVFPEKGRWVDISADVSLFQLAAVAATVNYAELFIENNKATVLVRLTATAAGTTANNIYILLPDRLTPVSGTTTTQPLGTGIFNDAGSNLYDGTIIYPADIGGLPAMALKVSTITDGNVLGVNPGIAIASGDIYGINATFEIA